MDIQTAAGQVGARLRAGVWSAGQCGIAASGAWAFSTEVLGHSRPFFASVAAVVVLGLRAGQRLRRMAELALGVAIGVLVGDAMVGFLGQGPWQIGVVVTVALLIAVAAGGAGLVVTQSGVQAVFVVALPRTPHSGFHRWQDALVGGAIALLVTAVLARDPWREAQRLRAGYAAELAAVLRCAAAGLRSEDAARVAEALARARALEPMLGRLQVALATGRETVRLSPLRTDRAQFWEDTQLLAVGYNRSTRNLRVLVRRVVAAVQSGLLLPVCVPVLLDELAAAVELTVEGIYAIPALLEIAGRLDPVALDAHTLASQVVVGQLRVAVVDLLDGLGVEHDRARNALAVLA